LSENPSYNVVGVITTLFKKGLTEKPSNSVIGVINRRNGCGQAVFSKGLLKMKLRM